MVLLVMIRGSLFGILTNGIHGGLAACFFREQSSLHRLRCGYIQLSHCMGAVSERDVLQCGGCSQISQNLLDHVCTACSAVFVELICLEAVIGGSCYPQCPYVRPFDTVSNRLLSTSLVGFECAVGLAVACNDLASILWRQR